MSRRCPQIDRAEAELRAEQRRMQIERANKILFDDTDRVRGFHSKMYQCDIIQENEALVGFKKQIGVLKKAQEAAFVEQQRQAIEVRECITCMGRLAPTRPHAWARLHMGLSWAHASA